MRVNVAALVVPTIIKNLAAPTFDNFFNSLIVSFVNLTLVYEVVDVNCVSFNTCK